MGLDVYYVEAGQPIFGYGKEKKEKGKKKK